MPSWAGLLVQCIQAGSFSLRQVGLTGGSRLACDECHLAVLPLLALVISLVPFGLPDAVHKVWV